MNQLVDRVDTMNEPQLCCVTFFLDRTQTALACHQRSSWSLRIGDAIDLRLRDYDESRQRWILIPESLQ